MTSASLLLGLSRKPLSPALSARADQMLRTGAAPTRQGLALLSETSFAATLKLDGGVAPSSSEPIPIVPPHPSYGTLETTLGGLYSDLRAVGAHAAEEFFTRRGLLLPASSLLPAVAKLKSQRELRPGHLSVLGPRGAYLMSLATQSPFSNGDPFLPSQIRAAFAKTASDRDVKMRPLLVGFALGTAQASGLLPKLAEEYQLILSELIALSEFDEVMKSCIASLLRRGLLLAAAPVDQLVTVILPILPKLQLPAQTKASNGTAPDPALDTSGFKITSAQLARYRLLRQQLMRVVSRVQDVEPQLSATVQAEVQTAQDLLSSPKAQLRAGLDPERFQDFALAAHLAQSSPSAAHLFHAAIHDKNLLLREHPALQVCLAAMDAEDYARSISNFASAAKAGWADPHLTEFLSVGTHTLNLEDSQRLATDALRGMTFGRTALGLKFILKLHPGTIGLIHDFEQKTHYGALPTQMLGVLAKAAEIDCLYPVTPASSSQTLS